MSTSLLRFAGASTLTVAGVCAAAAFPLLRWGGEDALVSMAIAAAVTLAGAFAGFAPLSRVPASDSVACVHAAMLGLGLRMVVTMGAVAALALASVPPHRGAFLLSAAALYLALLVVETRFAVRLAAPSRKTVAA
jgi:hypothetical protein